MASAVMPARAPIPHRLRHASCIAPLPSTPIQLRRVRPASLRPISAIASSQEFAGRSSSKSQEEESEQQRKDFLRGGDDVADIMTQMAALVRAGSKERAHTHSSIVKGHKAYKSMHEGQYCSGRMHRIWFASTGGLLQVGWETGFPVPILTPVLYSCLHNNTVVCSWKTSRVLRRGRRLWQWRWQLRPPWQGAWRSSTAASCWHSTTCSRRLANRMTPRYHSAHNYVGSCT